MFLYTLDGEAVKPGKLLGYFPGVLFTNEDMAGRPKFTVMALPNQMSLGLNDLLLFPNYEYKSMLALRDTQLAIKKESVQRLQVKEILGKDLNPFAFGTTK